MKKETAMVLGAVCLAIVVFISMVTLWDSQPQEGSYQLPALPVLIISTLQEVIDKNRETLAHAPSWTDGLTDTAMYIPMHLSTDVGPDPTIPDLLGYLLAQLGTSELRYLEIGVNVGKCLYQVLALLPREAEAFGMDLLALAPAFAKTLSGQEDLLTWKSESKWISKGSVIRFNRNTDRAPLTFFQADEFDPLAWEHLAKQAGRRPFQAIFSDGLHSPEALEAEWRFIKEHKLLPLDGSGGSWFMLWDDANLPRMRPAVEVIMTEMRQMAKQSPFEGLFLHVNGWLGKNEEQHLVGVASNLPLHELLELPWFQLQEPNWA